MDERICDIIDETEKTGVVPSDRAAGGDRYVAENTQFKIPDETDADVRDFIYLYHGDGQCPVLLLYG